MPTKQIIIVNHEARLHTVGGELPLRPGTNVVDLEQWTRLRQLDLIKRHYLARGLLEEKAQVASEDESPLVTLKPEQAIELVGVTYDEVLLDRWRAQEKRAVVLAEIGQQVDRLRAGMPAPQKTAGAEG